MEITKERLDLIEKLIKNNRNYSRNEDLYDDFFNETCKRSLDINKIITSDAIIEPYLRKVATTSILCVLKDSGRLRRNKLGYLPTNEIVMSDIDYNKIDISYENFIVKRTPEDITIEKDTLKQIINNILLIDSKEPEKKYLQIYKLRYDKGMTQKEISGELGLSQSEISKRLFRLAEEVKKTFR